MAKNTNIEDIEDSSEIKMTVRTCDQVANCLKELPSHSLIFIDVDDTIITPVSKAFRVPAHCQIIDQIKENKGFYPNYELIISHWRLQRKIQLVDPLWPELIEKLKENHRVFGLTKMDTGKFGIIPSMESWRHEELQQLGIEFSQDQRLFEHILPKNLNYVNPPSFYKGIFFTGSASKSDVISLYQEKLLGSSSSLPISLIDDRLEQILDIQTLCQKLNTPFTGIHFSGTQNSLEQPNSDIMAFQKNYLLENNRWLEDDEAERLIKKN